MALADINVRIGTKIDGLKKGLKSSERALKRTSRKFQQLGTSMTTAISLPVAAIVAKSVQAFDKQAQAIAQVEAGLISTNGVAGHTIETLKDMASGLQEITTYGDEEILSSVTAQLLTFTNVTNEQFPRAQKAILDLSARLGTDLKSAALQVGKALNDPVLGVTALARSGIQFSESQKKLIKSLVETNRTAEAQSIILKELENQFGGSAEAAAKAGLGPIKQFQNSLGDMMETVGQAVLPGLTDMVKRLHNIFKRFDELDSGTKKMIIQFSLIAAATGPVILGIGKAITVFSTLKGLLVDARVLFLSLNVVMRANPVLAVVSAITALIGALVVAYNSSAKFRGILFGIWEMFKELGRRVANFAKNIGGGFVSILKGDFQAGFAELGKAASKLNPLNYWKAGQKLGLAFQKGFNDKIEADKIAAQAEAEAKRKAEAEAEAKRKAEAAAAAKRKAEAEAAAKAFISPAASTITTGGKKNNKVAPLASIASGLGRAQSVEEGKSSTFLSNEETLKGLKKHAELAGQIGQKYRELGEQLSPFESTMGKLGEAIGGTFERGAASIKDFARNALRSLADVIGALIKKGVAGAIANTLASSPLGLFLAPAAGAAASALLKGVINKISAPKLAKGGVLHGRSLVEAGEYSGARSNPEVIAPLNTLPGLLSKAMGSIGGSGGQLVARVSGNDLLFIVERAEKQRTRFGIS